VSNLETAPAEVACGAAQVSSALPIMHVLHPREVPLGGPRAMRVQRTLPQRQRSLIGAWCFIDHYGQGLVTRLPAPPLPTTRLRPRPRAQRKEDR
jgi:quercetin 2,3-dioxygenase